MKLININKISYAVEIKTLLQKPEKKLILNSISFYIENGKTYGIAGESGSGKTTLAKILAGLIKFTDGEIILNDNLNYEKIQILFQNTGEILNPLRNVGDALKEAISINSNKKEINIILKELIQLLSINEKLLQKKCNELSGGEKQRVALARVLAVKPKVLILDEPFSAQDVDSVKNFLNLFKLLKEKFKLTLIIISHDLSSLFNLADKILILYKGEIAEIGDKEKIFNSPENSYTKFLLKAGNYNLTENELKENLQNEKN